MIPAITASNLVAASEQAALVVMLASLLVWALRIDAPGVRYGIWRTLAAVCLLLPWVQRHQPGSTRSVAAVNVVTSTALSGVAASPETHVNAAGIVLALLTTGALIRLLWLLLGVSRLGHLRRDGVIESSSLADDLQRTLGTRAALRYSSRVPQPVTFGLMAPVVLLPDSIRSQSLDIQRAVIGHELIHVQRRDWAWLLVEEVALCVFWFHPAAWWVASRIQLAREEVVDELTVLLTGRRKPYVEALLAFSDPMSVVPTAAFARRRHLVRRIALISREELMSSKRIVASCAVLAVVVFLGGWGAVSAFPLRAAGVAGSLLATGPGPLERRAHAVTPENPVPRRIHYEEPMIPNVAETVSGKVVVKVTLDETGAIAEARPVTIAAKGDGFDIGLTGDNIAVQLETSATRMPNAAAAMRAAVAALADSAVACVKAWRYDPPAQAPLAFSITILYGEPQVVDEKVLKVGGAVKPPTKIVDVRPLYPPDALAAGIEGVVILETKVAVDGTVEEARVIKSIPALDQAAIDAVKQWRFVPTLINGAPTAVMMTTTIEFRTK